VVPPVRSSSLDRRFARTSSARPPKPTDRIDLLIDGKHDVVEPEPAEGNSRRTSIDTASSSPNLARLTEQANVNAVSFMSFCMITPSNSDDENDDKQMEQWSPNWRNDSLFAYGKVPSAIIANSTKVSLIPNKIMQPSEPKPDLNSSFPKQTTMSLVSDAPKTSRDTDVFSTWPSSPGSKPSAEICSVKGILKNSRDGSFSQSAQNTLQFYDKRGGGGTGNVQSLASFSPVSNKVVGFQDDALSTENTATFVTFNVDNSRGSYATGTVSGKTRQPDETDITESLPSKYRPVIVVRPKKRDGETSWNEAGKDLQSEAMASSESARKLDCPGGLSLAEKPMQQPSNVMLPASARLVITAPVTKRTEYVDNPYKRSLCGPVSPEELRKFADDSDRSQMRNLAARRILPSDSSGGFESDSSPVTNVHFDFDKRAESVAKVSGYKSLICDDVFSSTPVSSSVNLKKNRSVVDPSGSVQSQMPNSAGNARLNLYSSSRNQCDSDCIPKTSIAQGGSSLRKNFFVQNENSNNSQRVVREMALSPGFSSSGKSVETLVNTLRNDLAYPYSAAQTVLNENRDHVDGVYKQETNNNMHGKNTLISMQETDKIEPESFEKASHMAGYQDRVKSARLAFLGADGNTATTNAWLSSGANQQSVDRLSKYPVQIQPSSTVKLGTKAIAVPNPKIKAEKQMANSGNVEPVTLASYSNKTDIGDTARAAALQGRYVTSIISVLQKPSIDSGDSSDLGTSVSSSSPLTSPDTDYSSTTADTLHNRTTLRQSSLIPDVVSSSKICQLSTHDIQTSMSSKGDSVSLFSTFKKPTIGNSRQTAV